jgi:hypothetical protein
LRGGRRTETPLLAPLACVSPRPGFTVRGLVDRTSHSLAIHPHLSARERTCLSANPKVHFPLSEPHAAEPIHGHHDVDRDRQVQGAGSQTTGVAAHLSVSETRLAETDATLRPNLWNGRQSARVIAESRA